MKIVAIIPAHLNSIRFPRKILFPIQGLPMIEHVRRRALLSQIYSDVIVATCDSEISDLIKNNDGKVIMTSKKHINGTSRVAEAVNSINCTHIVLLQGDEPLILPNQLKIFNEAIISDPICDAWNATGIIEDKIELDKHSFVKCIVSKKGYITNCFSNLKKFIFPFKGL